MKYISQYHIIDVNGNPEIAINPYDIKYRLSFAMELAKVANIPFYPGVWVEYCWIGCPEMDEDTKVIDELITTAYIEYVSE